MECTFSVEKTFGLFFFPIFLKMPKVFKFVKNFVNLYFSDDLIFKKKQKRNWKKNLISTHFTDQQFGDTKAYLNYYRN